MRGSVILGKSHVMFKENPLSVGTRLGYIFVLSASLYRSLSELAFGNLESGKLRFGPVRHTRSYLSNYISLVGRAAFFSRFSLLPAAHALLARVSSLSRLSPFIQPAVYVSIPFAAGKPLLRLGCQWRSPYYHRHRRTLEKGIPMHKYIRAKRALRALSVSLNSHPSPLVLLRLPYPSTNPRYDFRSCSRPSLPPLSLSLFFRPRFRRYDHPYFFPISGIRRLSFLSSTPADSHREC